jgi:hypothetical protein
MVYRAASHQRLPLTESRARIDNGRFKRFAGVAEGA